ncbi:MAG: prepilin-type N-terminal cleavage/methylation domain-containing protein, partial [Eubacterium sp.]
MQKKWKLNNKGMTLLEVIVAFAIFAVAATILFAGFNGAFKVIQNSNAIKDASQGSAGELE